MHTTKMLNSNDFVFNIDGSKASFDAVFPEFNEKDRIGIVVRKSAGGIGASALIMAAITRFYDFYRPQLGNESGKLRIYPDFFIFHVGKSHMNHYWMDVWPSHKEVIVENNPEHILEAINDRGITRLLVEDIPSSPATFLRETISSAQHRLVSALAYSPTGRVNQGDVSIMSCAAAEDCVLASLEMSEELTEEVREQLRKSRHALFSKGRVMETYRRVEVSDALHMLTQSPNLISVIDRQMNMP
ncbi:hypothetical protein [Niallia endozanthoxylica]|uniref:Uncharacterized protein n=1 Tax=Niallia endozanthoxylica TaxID=2036016 RepID=A0A5J5H8V0_9BACI|nr:hypothetical protein [Niallia endozanthoxylica]KAA9017000.1 hypothetical protein F4V44_21255 [Niallia endozanthoxylica]